MIKMTPEQIQKALDGLIESTVARGCECPDAQDSEQCEGCEPRIMSDAANAIQYLQRELEGANDALNKIDGMTRQPGSPPPLGLALSCVYQVRTMTDEYTRLDSENENTKGAMQRANAPCLGCPHWEEDDDGNRKAIPE